MEEGLIDNLKEHPDLFAQYLKDNVGYGYEEIDFTITEGLNNLIPDVKVHIYYFKNYTGKGTSDGSNWSSHMAYAKSEGEDGRKFFPEVCELLFQFNQLLNRQKTLDSL